MQKAHRKKQGMNNEEGDRGVGEGTVKSQEVGNTKDKKTRVGRGRKSK